MSQEPNNPNAEPGNQQGNEAERKEIELFPVQMERKKVSMNVAAGGGTRLGTQISIFEPASFDEALEIVECLRSRAATTITLDKMRKVDANRLVDFVSGASAALDGDFHKLTEFVYVFCPSNIKIVAPSAKTSSRSSGALDFLFSESGSILSKGN